MKRTFNNIKQVLVGTSVNKKRFYPYWGGESRPAIITFQAMQKDLAQKRDDFNEMSGVHQTLPLVLSLQEREKLNEDVCAVQSLFRRVQNALTSKISSTARAIGSRRDLWSSSNQVLAWLGTTKEALQERHFSPLHPDIVAKQIQEHKVRF